MTLESTIAISAWAALGVAAMAALGEWLHARRVRRIGRLAFGPDSRPRPWALVAPFLRVTALTCVVWALAMLWAFDGSSRARERNAAATRHLLVLLDVSPSMQLEDAGENGRQKRAARAAEVLKSVMDRANSDEVKITMACFYSHTMLLVKECSDREVIWNFANDLPLYIAYRHGKTDLVKSLNQAGELVKDFPRKTTTLLVLTDGDTVADSGLKMLPSSVGQIVFAGVGDATRGSFIDGHLSRQDSASLSQLARRIGGHYHNANVKHVPSELIERLTAPDQHRDKFQVNLRMLAIIVLAVGAALLCLLPVLLEYFGSGWKPVPVAERNKPVAAGRTGSEVIA
jgi:Ca-activated chloride channel family protein